MKISKYDVIIIGCGPAGMTAAMYIARAGRSVLILDREGIGGQMAKSPLIENFPGIEPTAGVNLAMKMYNQIDQLGVQFDLDEVLFIKQEKNKKFLVTTETTEYSASSIIIASGASPISLSVPGGTDYDGDGVYYCAVCDGPLFKNKDVLVVGSGNSGAQYALEMNSYCKSVAICDISPFLFCEKMLAEKIRESSIEVYLSETIVDITKNSYGKMIVTFKSGNVLPVDGVFVAIGQQPATECAKDLINMDERGYIVSSDLTTNIPGIFTAGDCRTKKIRQAVTAAGDGAAAAVETIRYLQSKE